MNYNLKYYKYNMMTFVNEIVFYIGGFIVIYRRYAMY